MTTNNYFKHTYQTKNKNYLLINTIVGMIKGNNTQLDVDRYVYSFFFLLFIWSSNPAPYHPVLHLQLFSNHIRAIIHNSKNISL